LDADPPDQEVNIAGRMTADLEAALLTNEIKSQTTCAGRNGEQVEY
jgi:hypothetical protein